jgi:hypothetical protein
MDPGTITTSTFTVQQGATTISGMVSYSDTTAVFVAPNGLGPNLTYTCTITTGAKDLDGRALANNYVWRFTTSSSYTVTLSSIPVAGGTASGGGTFSPDSAVTVTATPNAGYTFTNWTEGGVAVSTNPTYQFTISGNRILVANFAAVPATQRTVTLSSFPLAGGTTSGGGVFNLASSVIVTATPNAGYTFTNWTEGGVAVSTNPTYQFTISGNRVLVANFSAVPPTQFTVTVLSIPSAGGTTSGGGAFNAGSLVTVTATPNLGYTFTNWTENGIVITSSTSYQFAISGNRVLLANYAAVAPTQYTVTLSSIPLAGGMTSGSGAFTAGSSVIVTATPTVGYAFTNWTEGGAEVSKNPIYQFTISGNRILVANFTAVPPTVFTVTVLSIPSADGTASGGGSYNSGSLVTVTATPTNSGFTFTNWTENGIVVTSSMSYKFTISGNRTLVANFTTVAPAQFTITLSSNPEAGGTTSGGGAFNATSSVIVTATPNPGYTFTNWTEGGVEVSTNPIYQFTISGNKILVANFTAVPPIQFAVTVLSIPSAGGTTSGGGAFNAGSLVTVTATPNPGYTFTNWTENGTVITSSISYQFTISGNRTLVANFTAVPPIQYTVTLSSIPLAGGMTNGSGAFNSGSSVIITATPNPGYTFTNWTESGTIVSTNAGYTFTLSGNRTLVANFAPVTYTVTLSSNPLAGGTTGGGGTFNSGSSVIATAIPSVGYTFANWTEGGTAVSTNANYQFTIIGNRALVAHFNLIQYSVTLQSSPAAGGNLYGAGTFTPGSSVTVMTSSKPGWKFSNWTENGTQVSTNASYTFTISGDIILVANFIAGQMPVDLGSAGNFAILAGSGVANTGASTHIYGDVGSFPTATITGLLGGNVTGILYTTADPIVGTAKGDLTTAYNNAQGRSFAAISLPGQLGGLALAPGLYVNSTSSGISGTGSNAILTLDAKGDSNAVWIFKMGSTLVTDAGTSIVLAGNAQWKNIYWSVGSSATFGTNSIFQGNVLAEASITLTTGATLNGRALTRTAKVTLDTSTIDKR